MGTIDDRLAEMDLRLPPPLTPPPGVELPFAFVRVRGNRAYISGHGPQAPSGEMAGPFGIVGRDVTEAEAVDAARLTALSMLGSLQRALGSLDRVTAWLRLFGMVASTPDFQRHPAVINGCSELILALFGPDRGAHARSAIGVASLPFGIPVEIEGMVEIQAPPDSRGSS